MTSQPVLPARARVVMVEQNGCVDGPERRVGVRGERAMNWDYSGSPQKAQMDVAELSADESFRLTD
jgi:hypothetical protein